MYASTVRPDAAPYLQFRARNVFDDINGPRALDTIEREGLLSQDDSGGLYWRYRLRDYFPVDADESFIAGLRAFKEPGIWHSAPMAVLKKAFQILAMRAFRPSLPTLSRR